MFGKSKKTNKLCAIVLAAGSGSRMNSNIKKQFMEIDGKPVIYYSLLTISQSSLVDEIIVVTSKEDIVAISDIVKEYDIRKVSKIVCGGERRQDSVYNGLMEVDESYSYVLIHDGARPLVTVEDTDNVIKDAFTHGAATLAVKVKDTVKRVNDDLFAEETLDREYLYGIQTPQVIKKELLLKGYENSEGKVFTDDTSIVENIGVKVKLTVGNYSNIKLTTPEDLIFIKGMII